jgi:hypothetical protein
MKKGIAPIEAILITAVVVGIATIGIPWALNTFQITVEISEAKTVKSDFIKCSEKILETVRTGSSNKCILSVSKGVLFVRRDGIYYRLVGSGEICDPHEWALVDIPSKIWQRCEKSGENYIYELRWFYPQEDVVVLEGWVKVETPTGLKEYELSKKGYLNVEFESPEGLKGKTIELTRYLVKENTTVLSVRIY